MLDAYAEIAHLIVTGRDEADGMRNGTMVNGKHYAINKLTQEHLKCLQNISKMSKFKLCNLLKSHDITQYYDKESIKDTKETKKMRNIHMMIEVATSELGYEVRSHKPGRTFGDFMRSIGGYPPEYVVI